MFGRRWHSAWESESRLVPWPRRRVEDLDGRGSTPTWSRTRDELFFAAPDGRIMVAPYTVEGEDFRAGKPRPWSETRVMVRPRAGATRSFDLHPDGNRFALSKETQTEAKQDKLVFLFNFFDELRRVVPTRGDLVPRRAPWRV